MSFLFGIDGGRKFLRKTQKISRNWFQKKCSQPMPPLIVERREKKTLREGKEKRGPLQKGRKKEGQP